MSRILRHIFFLLLMFVSTVMYAQDTLQLAKDTTTVIHRKFDKEYLESLQKKSKYNYEEESYSILDKIKEWLSNLFNDFDMLPEYENPLNMNYFIIIIIIIVVGLIIYLLLQTNFFKLLTSKGKVIKIDTEIEEEDIHEIEFDSEILQMEKEQNYRRAIRLYFLKALKKLSDENVIMWNSYKTNYDYKYETRSSNIHSEFISCTDIFEEVWYGEKNINASSYEGYKKEYITLIQKKAKP